MNPRSLRIVGPAILVAAALAALVIGLGYGGGAAPLQLDPGPFVRWGLPVTKLVVNLTGALMVGSLVLALFALKPGERPFEIAMDAASSAAAVFTVASVTTALLTFQSLFGLSPDNPDFSTQLGTYLSGAELGMPWLITSLCGAVVTVLAFAFRTWLAAALIGVLAIIAVIPMTTLGHSGAEANHTFASSAVALHVIAACVWLGGLLLLILVRPRVAPERMPVLVARYSTLALLAFVVVAGSGLARAVVGVQAWGDVFNAYGALLVVKAVALVTLGILGATYRRKLIRALPTTAEPGRKKSGAFWGLVALELGIMGLASGAAVALSRTPPPPDTTVDPPLTPAERLTDAPLPPELTLDRWFTSWNIDLIWMFAVAFGLFFYLAGVWRVRRRGDRWPLFRTVLWVVGMLLLFWVTNGPVNAYQDYLFSVHMVGHMLLSMAIPVCLVAGAPVTLAARAARKREDGTRGGREWILWIVHTPVAKVLTHPLVASAIFIGSLWAFYYTDLFRWSLYDHIGHQWMIVHFLVTGYLFVQSLVGIDPVPLRLPYAFRLLTLIGIMAMHAFFGISIMMSDSLFVAEWFGSMGRTWGGTPLEDQYLGGGIAWSIGEIPTLILAITVAIQWSRSDERMQRRSDRHADRTGDRELEQYNERLAALAEQDAKRAAAGDSR